MKIKQLKFRIKVLNIKQLHFRSEVLKTKQDGFRIQVLALAVLLQAIGTVDAAEQKVASPNGEYLIFADRTITLVTSGGETLLPIIPSTAGDREVQVSWNRDSRKAVIVEDTARSSGIVVVFQDGGNWRKAVELDSDAQQLLQHAQAMVGGKLIAEHRKVVGWVSGNAVEVHGELTFSKGKARYAYVLELKPGTGRIDNGGFEEGNLVGRDYRLEVKN